MRFPFDDDDEHIFLTIFFLVQTYVVRRLTLRAEEDLYKISMASRHSAMKNPHIFNYGTPPHYFGL